MPFARRAARSTPFSLRQLRQAQAAQDFKLKVALQEGELSEHFWVTPFASSGDGFEGTLASDPAVLKGVKA
ncbi:DUF2314 domain-containing protein [Massilia sp. B-10]|nr:DUF2314 domain-containing protein [Massilia sp. B-10]